MAFLIKWLIFTLGIVLVTYIIPGVTVEGLFAAFVAALVLGLINAILKPIVIILTLPINILTIGLFTFVINALFVMLTAWVVPGFNVENFWWALLFGLLFSPVNFALNQIVKD